MNEARGQSSYVADGWTWLGDGCGSRPIDAAECRAGTSTSDADPSRHDGADGDGWSAVFRKLVNPEPASPPTSSRLLFFDSEWRVCDADAAGKEE